MPIRGLPTFTRGQTGLGAAANFAYNKRRTGSFENTVRIGRRVAIGLRLAGLQQAVKEIDFACFH